MKDRALLAALRLLPKAALSRVVGAATRLPLPPRARLLAMRAFAARYGIDLAECGDLETFRTFGEFFARPLLHSGLRPVAPGDAVVVSPVDGVVSQAGTSGGGRLVQAKGIEYALSSLLADDVLAARLEGGAWATIYLAPGDYHRIHFPVGGAVVGWRYVPGALWPVNPRAVQGVPGLFAANERLVTVVDAPVGRCAIVAVGATIVGRVHAFYDPTIPVTNARRGRAVARDYPEPLPVEKGQELGAFEMGSTVIVAFEPGRVALDARLAPGERVRVGERIASGTPIV